MSDTTICAMVLLLTTMALVIGVSIIVMML
jgi:hypothetical protein